ncbi:MAG TPA: hypothetical protein VFB33_01115 [Candidatus Binataceae bacterium]|jgi:hypothetical protein|nr:hypothetical protein [Candidatus Binataceae bacterium]
MPYRAEEPQGEEKFRLILGQIASIRLRLNALALQHGLFGALTFVLCAAALAVAAAFLVGALTFLTLALIAAVAAVIGVANSVRAAWRMHASEERAARIADERAALKGRLTTMVGAARGGQRSALWPYLVEDTLALREEFAPSRVQPRPISRWLYSALASAALAALVFHFALGARKARLSANQKAVPGEAAIDLGDLDIRPADPSAAQSAQIDADPATLKKLADKLAKAQSSAQHNGPASRLMADARDVASALQNKLTGGKPPVRSPARLKITDKRGNDAAAPAGSPGEQTAERRQKQSQQGQENGSGQGAGDSQSAGPSQPSNGAPNPGMPDLSGLAALKGLNGDEPGANDAPSAQHPSQDQTRLADAGPNGGGGANHGSGTDPDHLFGDADKPPLGNDTFKIPIEAQPSDEGFSDSAPAYVPARVKSKLNASQYPDEPFERASVPVADRVTIKRVFER